MVNVRLRYINRLLEIERVLSDLSPEDRNSARLERSKPILHEHKVWLGSAVSRVLPKSAFWEALGYCRNQ